MAVLKMGRPSEKQLLFLKATQKNVCFGGARGGGKSWVVRHKAIRLCLHYAGIKILIVRQTYRELINNHVNQLRAGLKGIAVFNKSDMKFTFANGSTIACGYCNSDNDLLQYQGVEYDVIFLEEATNLREEWIEKIRASLRGVNNFPKRTYWTCNPGGVSHNYVRRLFIDRVYEPGEDPEDYYFIQSKVTDNVALMRSQPDYKKQLENLPPKLKKAWLEGDWDIYDGLFFSEFADRPQFYKERTNTHVIEPFEVPKEWTVYRSFDFGYAKPFSVGWWTVDYDGRLYRIMELYGCTDTPNEGLRWTPTQIFQKITEIEREHRWFKGKNVIGVADPSIWDGSRGESVADMAAREQVYFSKGINDRIPGWMQVHYRLMFDKNGIPGMYVFNTCKAFIRTIPLLQHDKHKVEDLDTDGEDHVADEVRYMCMARPIKPLIEDEPTPKEYNPLDDGRRFDNYAYARV